MYYSFLPDGLSLTADEFNVYHAELVAWTPGTLSCIWSWNFHT